MSPRGRRIAATALAPACVLLLSGAAVAYVSWESAKSLVHPEREVPSRTPGDVGVPFSRVAFESADGTPLAGWWMPADADPSDDATVVFLHGYGASRGQAVKVAPFLHEGGFNVLAFDFRAHGESGGAMSSVGWFERGDVLGAVAHLNARPDMAACAPSCPVALFGWSMGAATALGAAPDVPGLRAIVADSSFATLRGVAGNSISNFTGLPPWPFGPLSVRFAERMVGVQLDAVSPVESIRASPVPVLLVHGTSDRIAPPEDQAALEGAARDAGVRVEAWLVAGAAHVDAQKAARSEYGPRVLAFLGAHAAS